MSKGSGIWLAMALSGGLAGALWLFAGPPDGGAPALSAPPATESASATQEVAMSTQHRLVEHRSGDWSPQLTDTEKDTLFAIARDTLAWCLVDARNRFDFSRYPLTPRLKQPMGTFVTLKLDGDLSGCIGTLVARDPLYVSVHENAINALMHDHRPGLRRIAGTADLERAELHVSILSPMTPIASVAEFKLGEHGIVLEKGMARAVFLPEVPGEQGWTRDETLMWLSRKAGLAADAWKEGARFKVFSSVVLVAEPPARAP